MTETANLALPLVQAGQAQKHVTVNEAMARLDALANLVVQSRTLAEPPLALADGAVFAVPSGATGDWAGQGGRLAIRINGGWAYADPSAGWRAWSVEDGAGLVHDGTDWMAGALSLSPGGAGIAVRVVEHDVTVTAGTSSVTPPLIPAGAIVFGVTGRVLAALGGSASSFRVGVGPEASERYGAGIGTSAGAWFRGVTGSPLAYYADTSLTLTAESGAFGGGTVRIAVHLAELGLPRA